MFLGGISSRVAALASEGNALERFLGGLGHFLGMALLIYAALQIIAAIGLLLTQNWARLLTLMFSAFGILVLLPRTIHLHPLSTLYSFLNLAVLVYLLLPSTQAFFSKHKVPDSTSRPESSALKTS
jgi:uncharacterized membrane protein (DUF2068 family)